MKTVAITGAGGDVGRFLRPELAGRYRLRLSDRRPITELAEGESFVACDVCDMGQVEAALRGVDAVLHLAAHSVEGDWPTIRDVNIDCTDNVYEAARRVGVRRVLFATSNHAVGFYERSETIDHRVYPKPDSRYGVSKAFGEALGSLYADKYGLEIFNIRIGNVNPRPVDKRRLSIWISPRDLAQLVAIGIDHPDVKFEVVYGVSDNARSWYDNANALRLGYRPQDRSEAYAEEVLRNEKPGDPRVERYQGGTFVLAEQGGDPFKK